MNKSLPVGGGNRGSLGWKRGTFYRGEKALKKVEATHGWDRKSR